MGNFNEMLKYLRAREKMSQADLASKLGISKSTIGMYELGKREPDFETLESIADLFNVDMNFLLGTPEAETLPGLTAKDNRDIAKDLDNIMQKLRNGEDGPASYDGTEIPADDLDLFEGQLELMLRRLKAINKEKYNPHKNKK